MKTIRIIGAALVAVLMVVLAGCGGDTPAPSGARKLTLQLNWKAEPEFGPFYAAEVNGTFRAEGLEVELRQGGSGAPTSDLVATKQVPFAVVSADQIVVARSMGKKIVGIFAVYQKDPMCIITHKARGLGSLDAAVKAPGTLAIERGMPFATWIEKTIGFGPAKIVPSPYGDLKYLQSDPNYAFQGFATSEPIAARKLGLDVDVFLVADAGFDSYQTVLAVHEDLLKDDPELVKRMTRAVTKGWEDYMKTPEPVNVVMGRMNPTMDAATFAAVTQAQIPHVISDGTRMRGPGTMSLERWTQLTDQMLKSGVIRTSVDPASCFRDPVEILKGS